MVALPKKEGGVGFKDLYSWNQVCLVRHMWAVLNDQQTLWIAWLKDYRLRNLDIWEVETKGSWLWNKVLQMRDKVKSALQVTDDGITWLSNPMSRFTIQVVWDTIRPKQPIVPWHELVWRKH
ncbi:unnamed protein product [Linum trigynum]|uniref:Uncharacterized protein n=1 Tax=Linum trigynum TaxID=586398 RepID=A0AAV2DS08_9ROSI